MSIQKVLKIQKEKSIDRFKWINRIRRWDLTWCYRNTNNNWSVIKEGW